VSGSFASAAAGRALLAAALLGVVGCASPGPAPPPTPQTGGPVASAPRPASPGPPASSALSWPLDGPILSGFGAVRGRRHHEGIDIEAPRGTRIRAAAAGRVVESRWRRGYGNVVTLDHGDGVRTRYAHLAERFVRVGAQVARDEPIATVGATGNATTPHLHFEVLRRGRARNPLAWMPPRASDAPSHPASPP
jgi:murein DD-endopeptidase MepM/ murein hydrolase activator NlpD